MNVASKIFCRVFQAAFRIALPVLPYREPKIVNSCSELKDVFEKEGLKSVLIVTDCGIVENRLTDALENVLAENGVSYTVYDHTQPNPTVENVEESVILYHKNNCDGIIAIGGGSAMDCAKALGARIAYPNRTVGQMKGVMRILKKLPTLIAIPTTAGTGSEVTPAAIITDSAMHHKYALMSFPLIPHYAVLDAALTYSLPPHLTATTGMDALTHAVEAYIGRSTTNQTRRLACEAVKLVFENVENAYTNGHNHEARRNMLHASYKAGAAFAKSYVGYIHAVAHSLGGQYGLPHGLVNAVIMPHVLKAYGKCIYKKLHTLGVAAGVCKSNDSFEAGAQKFIAAIEALNAKMGIPATCKGIKTEDISLMAKHAAREATPLYPVPKLMTRAELETIYYRIADRSEENMTNAETILQRQREFYKSGATIDVDFRIAQLKRLYAAVKKYETEVNDALTEDLGKSHYEGFMCESGLVLSEISYLIRHTRRFAKRKTVYTPLAQFASHSYKQPVPRGNTLIMSPWNYPFLLTMDPLAAAISAGNTAIVKPSAYSPATSRVIEKIIKECFSPDYVAVITGGRAENAALLEQKFDFVFFTGSQAVGKEVLRHTAEHLTPAVLELGGKSPCIVDHSANIKLAAKRIVFGKYLNCGQTCVAPDYILCHRSVKDEFIKEVVKQIKQQYGTNPLKNPDYGKIINTKHFERLLGLIDGEKVVIGGHSNPDTLQISPTVMDNVTYDDAVMGEEIFGPIMPILTFDDFDTVVDELKDKDKPLALYLFSSNKEHISKVTTQLSYGGGCINDVVIHLATSEMGFGGVGESGMGSYHGKTGFDAFSHHKSIVDKKTWLDLPMRYQPYKSKLYELLLHIFLR